MSIIRHPVGAIAWRIVRPGQGESGWRAVPARKLNPSDGRAAYIQYAYLDPGERGGNVLTAAQLAVMAANRVESAGACPAQRLAALLQLQRHVDGLVAKARADASNAPARDTGD